MEKLRGSGWLEAVHPEDLDPALGIYVSAFEARLPWSLEYRLRRADGAYRWMLASGVPRYGSDGSFAGYVGCDIDITERRNAEDQIRESRAALEASHREIQQLAGRLIEAQDAERARIARDLHDDVSQQLAGLSIALSGLKRRMDELDVGDELQDGSARPSRAHHHTRAERPSPLPRPASDRAATRRAGGRTDFLLRRSRAIARHGIEVQRRGGLRVHRPGGRALPVSHRTGRAAECRRARRREPGGRSIAPQR